MVQEAQEKFRRDMAARTNPPPPSATASVATTMSETTTVNNRSTFRGSPTSVMATDNGTISGSKRMFFSIQVETLDVDDQVETVWESEKEMCRYGVLDDSNDDDDDRDHDDDDSVVMPRSKIGSKHDSKIVHDHMFFHIILHFSYGPPRQVTTIG
jgi:hypothetical protein